MLGSTRTLTLALAAGLALGLGGAPAFAADAMSGPAIDCSKASAMMTPDAMHASAMHDSSMPEMKSTGNVDKDFAQMMMAHNHMMMSMAKVEVACGKDGKTKAVAQKALDQASADNAILNDLLKNDSKI